MNRLHALQMLGQVPSPNITVAGTTFDLAAAVAPLVSGALMGYVVYRTARSLKVDAPKARGVAITIGVTTALGQIANGWFHGWLSKAGIA